MLPFGIRVLLLFKFCTSIYAETNLTHLMLQARPSPAQLAWLQREIEMFVHIGPNTFIGVEWGSGRTDPGIFKPTDFDARQWVEVARSFGAEGIILTCKHHDGFCLWPTETTTYSIKASPWKNGQGDVVAEIAQACREAGMPFGVYVSPADLHQPSYGVEHEKYDAIFRQQLKELLTNYGEIAEVWFDGAEPSRRKQNYDLPSYYKLIRELQPNPAIAIKGPDVRWVAVRLNRFLLFLSCADRIASARCQDYRSNYSSRCATCARSGRSSRSSP